MRRRPAPADSLAEDTTASTNEVGPEADQVEGDQTGKRSIPGVEGEAGNNVGESTEPITHSKSKPTGTNSFGHILGCLYLLALLYGPLAYSAVHEISRSPRPPRNATSTPLDQFSEERAMKHVVMLAETIGNRQEGTPGLAQAATYLMEELAQLEGLAGSRLRFEVDQSLVTGSFNIRFLTKSMTMAYQNLTNIAVRISDPSADPHAAAVLVNSHYDSALYTKGASDCAGCVACMLETIRQIVQSRYVPPAPFVFLFNGGEELFLKAAHGFVTSHPWAPQIGAVLNLEASGSALPDLLIQSGPAAWPSRVYAQSALTPVASVVAQDVFPSVPGDTDFRVFSHDFDSIPGLDMVLILNSHTYHTPLDTPANLQPGALQTRGDNLLPLLQGFATAPELKTRDDRALDQWEGRKAEGVPVYFDLWARVLVLYSRPVALAAQAGLLGLLALLPLLSSGPASGPGSVAQRYDDLVTGMLFYAAGWVLAVLFPVLLAIARVALSRRYMNWLAQPYVLLPMFVPASVAGLLVPQILRRGRRYRGPGQPLPTEAQERLEWSNHWGGVIGTNALLASLITCAGAGTGFLPFWWAIFMLPALRLSRRLQSLFGRDSPLTLAASLLPAALPSAYAVLFGAVFVRFLAETMARAGTHPLPYGPYIPDVALAVMTGVLTALAAAPLAPAAARWLGHPHVVRTLCYVSILSAAYVGRMFPYSPTAPKRVVLQRLYFTEGDSTIVRSEYNIATADANDAAFVLQYVPQLRRELGLKPGAASAGQLYSAHPSAVFPFYPVSEMLDRSLSSPAPPWNATDRGFEVPHIRIAGEEEVAPRAGELDPRRRLHLELSFGSLQNVWAAVLNFTGPLMGWSLAGGELPFPESVFGGPPSYMLHYGGANSSSFQFWIEALGRGEVRIELGVLDHMVDDGVKRLAAVMPKWTAYGTSSSYISTHIV